MRRVIGLAIALAGCVTSGAGVTGTTTPVVYEEPPQDKIETAEVRPGFVWEKGRWDWQNGQWAWIGGHFEVARAALQWEAGRWERRGSSWHWIDGRWISGGATTAIAPTAPVVAVTATPMYPTTAPPPPRSESAGMLRRGEVYLSGHWDWQHGKWEWLAGHWEREHPDESWVPGRWELQGSYYVWVDGRWEPR